MAAAIALKEASLRGFRGPYATTVVLQRRVLSARPGWLRDGVFDDVDIALTWHPGSINRTSNSTSLADLVYKFDFYGKLPTPQGIREWQERP